MRIRYDIFKVIRYVLINYQNNVLQITSLPL